MWRAASYPLPHHRRCAPWRLYFVADAGDEIAGIVKFQLQDNSLAGRSDEAAFVHRLAVRRSYGWWEHSARGAGLRLDCEGHGPDSGRFTSDSDSAYHSDRQVGPYLVARYEQELQ